MEGESIVAALTRRFFAANVPRMIRTGLIVVMKRMGRMV